MSFSDSIRRGTATTTETRSLLTRRMISVGFSVSWKTTVAGQQLRQQDTEKLSEDVAQRQQIQKTERMEDALVLQVLANLALQRLKIGEDVPMGDDDATRLGRCS